MAKSISELVQVVDAYEMALPAFPQWKAEDQSPARFIDHTLLKTEATPAQIDHLCDEALEYQFAAVCVNSLFVPQVAKRMSGSPVKVAATVGFPLGAMPGVLKAAEAKMAVEQGAQEIDMVMAVGMLKAGEYQLVLDDVAAVAEAAHRGGALLKVIQEMGMLTLREKIMACLVSQTAGADFVKTSTGFFNSVATVEDVELMRRVVGAQMGVKAAGGVRSLDDMRAMLKAGANRIGTSAGVLIMKGLAVEAGRY